MKGPVMLASATVYVLTRNPHDDGTGTPIGVFATRPSAEAAVRALALDEKARTGGEWYGGHADEIDAALEGDAFDDLVQAWFNFAGDWYAIAPLVLGAAPQINPQKGWLERAPIA